jgi:hypothetical protein
MPKHAFFNIRLLLCIILVAGSIRCQKTPVGYLSNHLYYLQNPLYTAQGSVTVSSVLEIDGSTTPMQVALTKVVDANGNRVDSLVARKDSFPGFKDAISWTDSTLALLNSKIYFTSAPALSVNPLGGRIQLTPATVNVPAGTYTIDVRATNIRGSIDIPSACQIIVTPQGAPDTIYGGAYAGTVNPTTGAYLTATANPQIQVNFYPSTTNKIVFKWLDMNGKPYNAKTFGIKTRPGRWSFRQFDPYYPEILTDTSVEYQYPTVPNQFPAFQNTGADGTIPRGTYGCFYMMPAASNNMGSSYMTFTDMAFFRQGLYIVTITLPDIVWN